MSDVVKYSIKGTIVDSNNKPILGALIETSTGDQARSQIKGKFNLRGRYNKNSQFSISISRKNYGTISDITPFTQDNTIIKDIGIYSLVLLKKDVENEINILNNYNEAQLSLLKLSVAKDFVTLIVGKLTFSLKGLLFPAIVKLISEFGITNVNDLLKKPNVNFNDLKASCPANIEDLNKLINLKNKFTKQLSNLFKGISAIAKFLKLPPKLISALEKAIPPIKIGISVIAFIPSTTFTPIPVGPILIAKDIIKALEDIIKLVKPKLTQNLFQLNFLIEDFNKSLKMLSILDTLIQGCADEYGEWTLVSGSGENGSPLRPPPSPISPFTDTDGSVWIWTSGAENSQSKVSKELLLSTQEQSKQLSPVITNVNGFKMGVVSIDNVIVGGLKRRQAVARNKAGVIMLKGEPSFSSNDQILIDELVFYIEENDLKAD